MSFSDNLFKKKSHSAFASSSSKKNVSYNTYFSLQHDFPSLEKSDIYSDVIKENTLNFSEAIQKEVEIVDQEKKTFILEPGHACYSLEPDNHISVQYASDIVSEKEKEEETFSLAQKMDAIIDVIIKNWERFKNNFIEINGEDEYERMYFSPYYSVYDEEDDENIDE